jgi:hypothetical protein
MTPKNERTLKIGDVVVTHGPIGCPAMRVVGFGYGDQGTFTGPTAKLESLRRDDKDPARPAWGAEFLISGLRALPEGHSATQAPFYAFD